NDRRIRPCRCREQGQRPPLARDPPPPTRPAPRRAIHRAARPEGEADGRARGACGDGYLGLNRTHKCERDCGVACFRGPCCPPRTVVSWTAAKAWHTANHFRSYVFLYRKHGLN